MKLPAYKKMFSAAAAASVLLITAACGTDTAADAKTDTASSTSSTADSSSSSSSYTDGEYEAEGSYSTPGGTSKVTVDLTLEGDTITAVTVTPGSSGPSLQYQQKFAGGIADEVVGKSIDDLSVTKVAGSSLTSGGFNKAIEEIKADASA